MKWNRRNTPDGKKRFLINCVGSNGEDILDMKAIATEITRPAFLKHIEKEDLQALEEALGYAVGSGKHGGLHAASDWHIQYFSSRFSGDPCVYLVWSAIEYIFT